MENKRTISPKPQNALKRALEPFYALATLCAVNLSSATRNALTRRLFADLRRDTFLAALGG